MQNMQENSYRNVSFVFSYSLCCDRSCMHFTSGFIFIVGTLETEYQKLMLDSQEFNPQIPLRELHEHSEEEAGRYKGSNCF